jgi:hypothetical protein
MTRNDITFEEFDRQVRENVKAVAEAAQDILAEAPDMEVLNDLTTDYYDGVIKHVYERGFSLHDAKRYVRLMSQKLDENYAVKCMHDISQKYPETR